SAVSGVDEVTSVSAEGSIRIRVSFSWGTDLDAAASDLRDRLDRVVSSLPEEAERPLLRKYDLASFPILILGAAADLDPVQLRRLVEDQVKYRLERVPGVAAVSVTGGKDREIHVDIEPSKIQALGLTLDTVLNRIRAENINLPGGNIDRGRLDVSVRTLGQYTDLEQLGNTVVAVRQGAPIFLRDIASVEDSWPRETRIVRINGRPGVRLVINKQSGSNTAEVADNVLKEIDRIRADLPQINLSTIIDTSKYIKRSVTSVGSSALYGGTLAILVILFFLRNLRFTFILATAIPVSIIATFGLMYFGDFTLNIMTLGGLALGVGMLVDNAIVVLENIFRLRESGQVRYQAAVSGSNEVTGAIVASTLTTLTVFLPLIFMRGMAGVMFTQLSYVIGFSLLCSLAVALTLVPMLASKLMAKPADGQTPRALPRRGRFFVGLENNYKGLLRWALSHPWLIVLLTLAILGASLWLFGLVGTELMPDTDEGEVRVYAEMEVGTRVEVLDEKFRQIEAIVDKVVPEKEDTLSFLGGTPWRPSGSHTGQLRIALKPQAERSRSSEEIAAALRRQLSGLPGLIVRTRPGRGLYVMRLGFQGDDRVQIEIRGYDLQAADDLAREVMQIVQNVQGVTDARMSSQVGGPEELVIIDRVRAADLKVTVAQVAHMLQTVLSGTRSGFFRQGGNEYPILVRVKDAEDLAISEILDLTLTNSDGVPVTLSNVVKVRSGSGPVRIQRKDQERVVTVSAEVSGRNMSSVIADIRHRLRSVPLPHDFSIIFGGDYEEQQSAFRELLLSLALALVLVYMVMACQFESLRQPLVVMFSVPFAAIGVILMLFLSDTAFNIQSFIGCIMLGGIVVNNAILLVDHATLLRRRDLMALDEAVAEASRRRLRPILMTALTTIFGLSPLALGLGEGGETQAPMARAVIGGLMSSTLITLVLVPTIYSLIEGRSARRPQQPESASSQPPAT
ncbi:MAG: efflux RND transporter permease subunit, partial [Deltaproteobacteria bacterium]|nr:efflux RND transporter permease subunit [Deltaproteobacteria bacterium]